MENIKNEENQDVLRLDMLFRNYGKIVYDIELLHREIERLIQQKEITAKEINEIWLGRN